MERFRFTSDAAFTPRDELLERVTVAPLSMPIAAGSAAIFRLAPVAGSLTTRPRPADPSPSSTAPAK